MIDTHVHHFDLERFRYPWLEDPEFAELRRDYEPAQYRADAGDAGLEGWVHVQAEVDHEADPVDETAWVTALAQRASAAGETAPLACVVYADLRDPEVERVLERQCAYPLTRGVRQEAWSDPASTRADIPREDLLGDPDWGRGYRCLEDFGLSFDLLVFPRQLQQAAAVIAGVPGVPVVLDHLGVPDPEADPGLETWRAGVAALAQLPHVHVKLSALSMLGDPRRADRVRPVLAELLELFGPRRCMFGSNFPVEALAGDFASMFELFSGALAICRPPTAMRCCRAPRGASTGYRASAIQAAPG